jgi:hypothetical protein
MLCNVIWTCCFSCVVQGEAHRLEAERHEAERTRQLTGRQDQCHAVYLYPHRTYLLCCTCWLLVQVEARWVEAERREAYASAVSL